jgi:hypothetical protein
MALCALPDQLASMVARSRPILRPRTTAERDMIRRLFLCCLGCFPIAVLPAKPAGADELPSRKPGLWEIKIVTTGSPAPPMTIQQCTDAAADRAMIMPAPTSQRTCSKQDIRKTATGFAADTECTVAGRSVTSHSDVAGDLNSAYTITTVSQIRSEGSAEGSRTITSRGEARWLGACKPDQKPGDVVMPGGQKVNIMDLQKSRNPLPSR